MILACILVTAFMSHFNPISVYTSVVYSHEAEEFRFMHLLQSEEMREQASST
jgi:hypothetical protein